MSEGSQANEPAWTVVVAPEMDADSIAISLRSAGLTVQEILSAIGVIIVRGSEPLAQEARKIRGVIEVSKEASIDIGPPDSEIS